MNPTVVYNLMQSISSSVFNFNKNTLTGPANCKKQLDIMPTYHYVQNQGKLIMQSQENGQKPQFGQFFDDFEVKYLQIANFSEK